MIKKLEAEDIVKLQELDDHVEDFFPCSKIEWNQWLMFNAENPNALIIGNGQHYLVAVNSVQKPLSDHVLIVFCYAGESAMTKEMKESVDEWAKEKGAKSIQFLCQDIKPFEKYGAEQKSILGGWKL